MSHHENGKCCAHHAPIIISGILLLLMALIHLLRIIYGWSIMVNGQEAPIWASYAGMIIAGGVAIWDFCYLRCHSCKGHTENK